MNKKRSGFFVFLLVLLVLVFIGAAVYYSLKNQPVTSPVFTISNFMGKPQISNGTGFRPANRGESFEHNTVIKTGDGEELDFSIPGKINFRIKENTEIVVKGATALQKPITFGIEQRSGVVLACSEKAYDGGQFYIGSPVMEVVGEKSTTLRTEIKSDRGLSEIVGVLKGNVEARSGNFLSRTKVPVNQLERLEGKEGLSLGKPRRVTSTEWNQLKEAYEVCITSASVEAEQLDLSKKAGTFFKYVFDHGTFFTPKIGYARREFFVDEASGEVYFEVEYDVFPKGSYVGMYTKARNFDLSKFKALEFEVRTVPGEGIPESFRIEVKSGTGTVKVFQPFGFSPEWKKIQVPLQFHKPIPISEVTVVFLNDKVGKDTKGIVQYRNFNVIPMDSDMPLANVPASESKAPMAAAAQSQV